MLDESGHLLEEVIKALKEVDDISRIPNSYVPGILEHILNQGSFADHFKIMTGLALNCVKSNCRITRPSLDIEQERLQEIEKNKLKCIVEDRQ